MKKLYFSLLILLFSLASFGQTVFINEIHYDNDGGDTDEGVEIAGPAGTDLSTYTITAYNGSNGASYDTTALSGTIPNQGGTGFGTVWFAISDLQNGAPDGLALDNGGTLIQFLSYEGSFAATDGVAIGQTSVDIGVSESSSTAVGESLQLTGTGTTYADFTWSGPSTSSTGSINTGQTFSGSSCGVTLGTATYTCASNTAGANNDNVTINIPYTGLEATITSVTTTASGATVGGDSPASVTNGTITITGLSEGAAWDITLNGGDCDGTTLSGTVPSTECDPIIPPTNSLVITGVYDGDLTGGLPKGIELYVINSIPDLSIFGLGSANNGGGTDGEEFTFPAVSATAGDYIYVASESTEFANFFGFAPDYIDLAMAINGDDAVELFENGQVIDVFGDINTDGSGQAWDYEDGWAYRNTAGPSSTFTVSEWDYSGANALDGETTNASATTPFPIATYNTSVLSVVKNQIENFVMYPNPVSNGVLYMSSSISLNKNVEIYSLTGQRVYSKNVQAQEPINILNLNKGIYLVKIEEAGKIATRKLVVN